MAQLFFRYSTMNAGKSIELIKVAYNYEERGKHVLVLTSDWTTGSASVWSVPASVFRDRRFLSLTIRIFWKSIWKPAGKRRSPVCSSMRRNF